MAPLPQSQSTPADTRFLEPRQSESLPPVQPSILERDAVAEANHDLTLSLLLSRRAPPPEPLPEHVSLEARQTYVKLIPQSYQGLNDGPAPGTVVGIVLGSVAGFLVLLWLLWIISNGSGTLIRTTGDIEEVDIRDTRTSTRQRRTRPRRTEMTSRQGSPRRVVRTERIIRDFGPDRSPSVARDRSRVRETIIVDERDDRFDGDDVVEVIEEHTEQPRRERRNRDRDSSYNRSVVEERVRERVIEVDRIVDDDNDYDDDSRIAGGYRTVDPRQFGGGGFKPHRMR